MCRFPKVRRVFIAGTVCVAVSLTSGCSNDCQRVTDAPDDPKINQIPSVKVTFPHHALDEWPAHPEIPEHAWIAWEGRDPDGDPGDMTYKYIFLPMADIPGGTWPPGDSVPHPWLPPLDHDSSAVGRGAPPMGYWSEWVPADCTCVSGVDLSSCVDQWVVGVVTARDEDGGVLREEDYPRNPLIANWIRARVIPGGFEAPVSIDGGQLGWRSSDRRTEYLSLTAYLFPGTKIGFTFWQWENPYNAILARACRYYFDDPAAPTWNAWTGIDCLRRPECSPEWWVTFPAEGATLEPSLGPHIFVVEVRDIYRTVTHCEFRIEVVPGPGAAGGQMIYLVDDDRAKWLSPAYTNYEASSDSLWAGVLDGYAWMQFDTGAKFQLEVPVAGVGNASTVIWLNDYDPERPTTYLTRLCYYRNYLGSYVMAGGNLIVIGADPIYSTMFWPDGTPPMDFRDHEVFLDFRPRLNGCDSTWTRNFNWEVFGIEKMEVAAPAVAFKTLSPCEAGWDPITTDVIPGVPGWPGKVDNSFYITQVRSDITVHSLYSVIPVDGSGNPSGSPDCTGRLIGVWVPGDGTRGHAAYIGVPPWFFNHAEIITMVRHLLAEFGEAPAGR